MIALLAPRSAGEAGLLDVERDLFEFAVGRVAWSRAELLAMPLCVRRQHLTWLREHLKEVAEAQAAALASG